MSTPLHLLTFDLEDWFHILDHESTRMPEQWEKFPSRVEANTERLLDLLDRHDIKATWFCLGWIAERFPQLVRKIAAKHEVAAHTYHHELAYQQVPSSFTEDAMRVRKLLEDISGQRVTLFRAAGFSITPATPWFAEALLEAGYEADSSIFPGHRNHGGFASFPSRQPCVLRTPQGDLMEFPISTHRWLFFPRLPLGGGYFRLMPGSILKRWLQYDDYVLTYFHPRDFDSRQPRLSGLPIHRRFMSYYGLSAAFHKLDQVLSTVRFHSIDSVRQSISVQSLPVFSWPPEQTR